MGLDLGFEKAGFEVRVASDIRKEVCQTIRANRPKVPVIEGDITAFNTESILEEAGLAVGEATLVTGGPPCQPFSTAGTRKGLTEKRGTVLLEYIRVIKEARPQFFVFENVKGLTSAALKHMSFYERIKKKDDEIEQDARLGTAFKFVLEKLAETGYKLSYGILNAADYGAPQKRERLIILGSRDGQVLELPEPTHDKPQSLAVLAGQRKPWVTLREALRGLREEDQEYIGFPPSWGKYMKYIKPGGFWRDLPEKVQKEAMQGSYYSQGGRTGFFRRLSWDAPSPTLVTSPIFKGTCLAHPDHHRPLSVQEYARIQGFPDDWIFQGSIDNRYRMIGEAVPVPLSYAIAKSLQAQAELPQVGQKTKRRSKRY
jgi:DNA (cytosine-5)-methyltransferase 1